MNGIVIGKLCGLHSPSISTVATFDCAPFVSATVYVNESVPSKSSPALYVRLGPLPESVPSCGLAPTATVDGSIEPSGSKSFAATSTVPVPLSSIWRKSSTATGGLFGGSGGGPLPQKIGSGE